MLLNRLMAALAAAWLLAAPAPSRALDFPTGVVRIIENRWMATEC